MKNQTLVFYRKRQSISKGAYTVLAWKDDFWGLTGRMHYTLVTVAAVAFVWFLNYWNLLG